MQVGIARIVDNRQTGTAFIMLVLSLVAMDGLVRMSPIVQFAGHVKSNTGMSIKRTQNDHMPHEVAERKTEVSVTKFLQYAITTILVGAIVGLLIVSMRDYSASQKHQATQVKEEVMLQYAAALKTVPPYDLIEICADESMSGVWIRGQKSDFNTGLFTQCLQQTGFYIIYEQTPK